MQKLHVIGIQWLGVFIICACTPSYITHVNNTGDYVSAKDGVLGWSGIFLNEHLIDVDKQLGRILSVHDQAFPSCGQYASQIILSHRIVTMEWSGPMSNPTIDSIYVDIPSDESTLDATVFANDIIQRIPRVEWMANGYGSAQLKYANGNVILIRTRNGNFLLITLADCLD